MSTKNKIDQSVKTYAQNCEDLILSILLPIQNGFYVDVGANMPDVDSVTKKFYKMGWHGINVEPILSLYQQLLRKRPKDINLNIGVTEKSGVQKFREYQGGIHGWSTFSDKIKGDSAHKDIEYKDYDVKTRTLKEIFNEQKVKNIDFLKVDVEGLEYQVLKSNDWRRYRPKVIVVEENTPESGIAWRALLEKENYKEIFFDSLNRYFVLPELYDKHDLLMSILYCQITNEYQKICFETE